ncbi:MAG: helix-turn-helix domain-containing protein [Paracoccus sp. (in: a-proteobacteria)]
MDEPGNSWHYPAMNVPTTGPERIPAWQLYGERVPFPDILHLERISDRAAGLDWRISPHRHTHLAQLFLLERGEVDFAVDGQIRQPDLPVLAFLPPGIIHGFTFAAGTEGWVLTLPVESHPLLFGPESDLAALTARPFTTAVTPRIASGVRALAAVWAASAPLRRTRLRGMLAQLLCDIFEDQARAANDHGTAGRRDQRLAQFIDLIARHHTQHWTIDRYARELGMSPRNLSRLCRTQTGQSPHHLLEDHLMREACRLLAYTRLTAQAVAYQLGYLDPSYFNRRFRGAMGLSPGAYRRKLEE